MINWYNYKLNLPVHYFQKVLKNSSDRDPDCDFWLDPDSIEYGSETLLTLLALFCNFLFVFADIIIFIL